MLALTLTGTREPLAFGQQQRDHINDQSVFQARSTYFPTLSVPLFFSYLYHTLLTNVYNNNSDPYYQSSSSFSSSITRLVTVLPVVCEIGHK